MRKQFGFTLVELAIVLVVIGLIMGMAFKGRDLIDSAKVRNAQAQYNKIAAALNIYQEKYGSYPGDGWTTAPGTATTGATGSRNGLLDTDIETAAAMTVLQNSGLLASADLQNAFNGTWSISTAAGATHFDTGINYLTAGGIANNVVDVRFVCQIDRIMDDGMPESGFIRSNVNAGSTAANSYDATVDCWKRSGLASLGLRLLP